MTEALAEVGLLDTSVLIATTAATVGMPIITQDRDFFALSGVDGLTMIEV